MVRHRIMTARLCKSLELFQALQWKLLWTWSGDGDEKICFSSVFSQLKLELDFEVDETKTKNQTSAVCRTKTRRHYRFLPTGRKCFSHFNDLKSCTRELNWNVSTSCSPGNDFSRICANEEVSARQMCEEKGPENVSPRCRCLSRKLLVERCFAESSWKVVLTFENFSSRDFVSSIVVVSNHEIRSSSHPDYFLVMTSDALHVLTSMVNNVRATVIGFWAQLEH